MPEGNEIHRWAEMHTRAFAGRKVRVDAPNGRFTDAAALDGKTLRKVMPVGKHLGYDFGKDTILHIHMGMYGDFAEGVPPMPEPRGALRLRMFTKADWVELRGPTDCSLYTQAKWEALLARIGPDPLNGDVPAEAFELIRKRKTPIGALLMDQKILSGIGNIFRAELLFRAFINPFRPGTEVELKALRSIWKEARPLMRAAMVDRRIVTTKAADRPHKRGTAQNGEEHYVYRRAGLPCFLCGTEILKKDLVGRTVFWCPKCQAR